MSLHACSSELQALGKCGGPSIGWKIHCKARIFGPPFVRPCQIWCSWHGGGERERKKREIGEVGSEGEGQKPGLGKTTGMVRWTPVSAGGARVKRRALVFRALRRGSSGHIVNVSETSRNLALIGKSDHPRMRGLTSWVHSTDGSCSMKSEQDFLYHMPLVHRQNLRGQKCSKMAVLLQQTLDCDCTACSLGARLSNSTQTICTAIPDPSDRRQVVLCRNVQISCLSLQGPHSYMTKRM
jgi:hypothetical protein